MGLMTTEQALQKGWKVAALDLNIDALKKYEQSEHILAISVDITDYQRVADAANLCEKKFGPITRVVNAAAIMPLGEVAKQPRETIQKVMSVNYMGMINVVDAAVQKMLDRGHGEFVNYASMAGHWPTLYMGAYNAAKHAVAAFTEVLYHENKHAGVRIVCVCPPIVSTPLLNHARDTVWPKLFDRAPLLEPQTVLDSIEKHLAKKKNSVWVFPGPLTRLTWRLRRWFPSTMWKLVHWAEK